MGRTARKEKAEPIRMVGSEPTLRRLSEVKPNTWNPNRMTPFERASLREGFLTDGWVKSQSLLVWRTDEKGKKQDIIIDGEQRWTVATEMRLLAGPMVMLDGITEKAARALTIKMDKKRGAFDEGDLAEVLRSIADEANPTQALSLGFEDEDYKRLLALESGAFLNDLANTPAGTDYHSAETTKHTDPETGQEFVKFSLYLKASDHAVLIAALALARKKHGVATNAEGLLKIIGERP